MVPHHPVHRDHPLTGLEVTEVMGLGEIQGVEVDLDQVGLVIMEELPVVKEL